MMVVVLRGMWRGDVFDGFWEVGTRYYMPEIERRTGEVESTSLCIHRLLGKHFCFTGVCLYNNRMLFSPFLIIQTNAHYKGVALAPAPSVVQEML